MEKRRRLRSPSLPIRDPRSWVAFRPRASFSLATFNERKKASGLTIMRCNFLSGGFFFLVEKKNFSILRRKVVDTILLVLRDLDDFSVGSVREFVCERFWEESREINE